MARSPVTFKPMRRAGVRKASDPFTPKALKKKAKAHRRKPTLAGVKGRKK